MTTNRFAPAYHPEVLPASSENLPPAETTPEAAKPRPMVDIPVSVHYMTGSKYHAALQDTGDRPGDLLRPDEISLVVIIHDDEEDTARLIIKKHQRENSGPGTTPERVSTLMDDINALCGNGGKGLTLIKVGQKIKDSCPQEADDLITQIKASVSRLRQNRE